MLLAVLQKCFYRGYLVKRGANFFFALRRGFNSFLMDFVTSFLISFLTNSANPISTSLHYNMKTSYSPSVKILPAK